MSRNGTSPPLAAVSLKMYFSAADTRRYVSRLAELAAATPAVSERTVEVVVLPTFPLLESTASVLARTPVRWGAQDVAASEDGAQTGEVSAAVLAELGCSYVEVGHFERRKLFAETQAVCHAKLAAVARAGMTPLYCLGERERPADPAEAAEACLADLDKVLAVRPDPALVVAYEPAWAIGAPEPAEPAYVEVVCTALRERVRASCPAGRVIYGGAAGVGSYTGLAGCVDGVFLGRFAHDIDALAHVIDEMAVAASRHPSAEPKARPV